MPALPPTIDSPYGWWDATEPGTVLGGSAVHTWKDKERPTYDLTQATESRKPQFDAGSFGPNSLDAVTFDGVDDFLYDFTPELPDFFSVYVAFQKLDAALSGAFYAGGGNRIVFYWEAGELKVKVSGVVIATGVTQDTDPHVLAVTCGAGINGCGVYLDGTLVGSATTDGDSQSLRLGGEEIGTYGYANVRIGECVRFEFEHETSDRLKMEDYLSRWITAQDSSAAIFYRVMNSNAVLR